MDFWHKLFGMRPRRRLKEMYYFSILFSIASSLIFIFEPVFFYTQGIHLAKIAMYYALHYTLYAFLLPLGGKFASRFGLERSLAISLPIFVAYLVMLAVMPTYPNLFWLTWIVLTLFKILYWPAYHAEFSKFGDEKNRGTELSWIYAATWGVGILGPVIGGAVAFRFGFPVLFVLAAALALVASVPLLRTKESYKVRPFSYGSVWRIIVDRRHRRMNWAMLGWGENLIDYIYWPVFMFIIVGSVERLGFIASLSMLVMTLFGFFIGEVSDRFSGRLVLRWHVPLLMISFLLRPLAGSTARVMLTDVFSKTSFIGLRIPMWRHLYSQAQRYSTLQYVVALELVLAVSKALTAWALVLVFAVMLPYTGFVIAFMLAAALTLFYLLL